MTYKSRRHPTNINDLYQQLIKECVILKVWKKKYPSN